MFVRTDEGVCVMGGTVVSSKLPLPVRRCLVYMVMIGDFWALEGCAVVYDAPYLLWVGGGVFFPQESIRHPAAGGS